MVVKLIPAAGGIELKIGFDFDRMRDIRTCSTYEKLVCNLALKYAFMNVLRIAKPNIFIIDTDYNTAGMFGGNEKKFKKMFDQIKRSGTNVMVVGVIKKMRQDSAFKIRINNKDGVSVTNNIGKFVDESMYANNDDGESEAEYVSESSYDSTSESSRDRTSESD